MAIQHSGADSAFHEREMTVHLRGLVDTSFEEGNYESALVLLNRLRHAAYMPYGCAVPRQADPSLLILFSVSGHTSDTFSTSHCILRPSRITLEIRALSSTPYLPLRANLLQSTGHDSRRALLQSKQRSLCCGPLRKLTHRLLSAVLYQTLV